jgi:hypothetical protein
MGGKGGSPPPPPDYRAAAQAQGEANREVTEQQTWANRPDQFTPWGSSTWQQERVWDPTTEQYLNRWAQTTEVDPMAQWALNNQMWLQGARSELGGDLMGRAQQEFGTPMDWSQFTPYAAAPDVNYMGPADLQGAVPTWRMQQINQPGMVQGPQVQNLWQNQPAFQSAGPLDLQGAIGTGGMQDVGIGAGAQGPQGQQYTPEQIQRGVAQTPEEIRNRAEQAIYERSTSRLDPQWEQREADTVASLRARGMRPGDEAYDREMANLGRQREDAYQTAMTESIMGGGAEGQRQYEQMLGRGQFANQAAQQALQQQLGIGGQQFQEQLAGGQFDLAQQQQQYQQEIGLRENQFMEEAARRGMSNEEAQQEWQAQRQQYDTQFQQEMARRQAYNQTAQQRFEQQLGAGEFGRQQNLQQFEAQMAQREQQFKEAAAQRGMSNEEAEREWQMQRTQLDNMFQQQMQQAGYQNQLRQAQIAEEMQRRGFSLNEINALISGQQVGMPTMPQFSGAQAAQPAPYFQAADTQHQANLGSWSAQQAQRQAGAGFFGDLLGTGVSAYSAGMFSDRRLKRNVRRVGSTPAGQPTYTWNYVWGEPAFGVMADESPPEAVFRHPSGYLMVDYTRIR